MGLLDETLISKAFSLDIYIELDARERSTEKQQFLL